MNEYLLFAGDIYYPQGGWEDYHSSYSSLEEALEEAATLVREYSWWHIVHANKIVREG